MPWTVKADLVKRGVAGTRRTSPSLWLSPRTAGREDMESRIMWIISCIATRCEVLAYGHHNSRSGCGSRSTAFTDIHSNSPIFTRFGEKNLSKHEFNISTQVRAARASAPCEVVHLSSFLAGRLK